MDENGHFGKLSELAHALVASWQPRARSKTRSLRSRMSMLPMVGMDGMVGTDMNTVMVGVSYLPVLGDKRITV